MKWFDSWFARKCKWAWENRDEVDRLGMNLVKLEATTSDEPSFGDGLNINVHKIIGGYVISFRTYDRRADRSASRHYIITDDQDFERELGKMITLESMRQT